MSNQILKELAIEKAKCILSPRINVFTQLYMIPEMINIKDISDCMEYSIFDCFNNNIEGWLFFLDKVPFANWSHPCEYLFIMNNEAYIVKEHDLPPMDNILLEKIEVKIQEY